MIAASFSLSLPRLGWKSTSTPRSLKICTAAGDSASEMRTRGLDIELILCKRGNVVPIEAGLMLTQAGDETRSAARGRLPRATMSGVQAAFGREALACAKAQSIHCVRNATSFESTVAPHQMRKPAGASR